MPAAQKRLVFRILRAGVAAYVATFITALFGVMIHRLAADPIGIRFPRANTNIVCLSLASLFVPVVVAGAITSLFAANQRQAVTDGLVVMSVWSLLWVTMIFGFIAPITGGVAALLAEALAVSGAFLSWSLLLKCRWQLIEPEHQEAQRETGS